MHTVVTLLTYEDIRVTNNTQKAYLMQSQTWLFHQQDDWAAGREAVIPSIHSKFDVLLLQEKYFPGKNSRHWCGPMHKWNSYHNGPWAQTHFLQDVQVPTPSPWSLGRCQWVISKCLPKAVLQRSWVTRARGAVFLENPLLEPLRKQVDE